MRTRSSDEGWSGPIAHEIVAATAPKDSYAPWSNGSSLMEDCALKMR